jgi:branched-chain amino acid transport system ATP-binding protein
MLEVKGLTKFFGGLEAVSHLDMTVQKGQITGLIGPNGAGKTTAFNLLTGVIKPTRGKVIFEEEEITGWKPHTVAKKGMIRTFQATNIYPDFTVLDNIVLSCHLKPGVSAVKAMLHTKSSRRKDSEVRDWSQAILDEVGLGPYARTMAKNLAHGHKRTLGIACALACDPKLLMLDEPLGGMNGEEVTETMELVTRLWEKGITVLLIEHNMRATMSLCHHILVINFGKKIAEGTPEEIKANPDVVKAYLGAGNT